MKNTRNIPGEVTLDPAIIHNIEHNNAAGSKKVSEVGRHLLPIPFVNAGVIAYKTDVSTLTRLPAAGKNLAVYNNSTTVAAITTGPNNTLTALASGVTNSTGQVGIPCMPNAWTYIAAGADVYVISSAATLLTFLIDDPTTVKQEAATFQEN